MSLLNDVDQEHFTPSLEHPRCQIDSPCGMPMPTRYKKKSALLSVTGKIRPSLWELKYSCDCLLVVPAAYIDPCDESGWLGGEALVSGECAYIYFLLQWFHFLGPVLVWVRG